MKQARAIIKELDGDSYFADKSHLQPDTHACLIGCSSLLIRQFFEERNLPMLPIKQLMVIDEEKAIKLLKLMYDAPFKELYHWADVFAKSLFIQAFQDKFPHQSYYSQLPCNRTLPLHIERLVLLGDHVKLENFLKRMDAQSLTELTIPNPQKVGENIQVVVFAAQTAYCGLLKSLFQKGARVLNNRDKEGISMWAMLLLRAANNVVMAKLLIDQCDPQELNGDDLDKLATELSDDTTLPLFFSKFANTTVRIQVILDGACKGANVELAKLALKALEGRLDEDNKIQTLTDALCFACGSMGEMEPRIILVDLLLKQGALINGTSEFSGYETPLHNAAFAEYAYDMVPYLLERGAIDRPSKNGKTALSIAFKENYDPNFLTNFEMDDPFRIKIERLRALLTMDTSK